MPHLCSLWSPLRHIVILGHTKINLIDLIDLKGQTKPWLWREPFMFFIRFTATRGSPTCLDATKPHEIPKMSSDTNLLSVQFTKLYLKIQLDRNSETVLLNTIESLSSSCSTQCFLSLWCSSPTMLLAGNIYFSDPWLLHWRLVSYRSALNWLQNMLGGGQSIQAALVRLLSDPWLH